MDVVSFFLFRESGPLESFKKFPTFTVCPWPAYRYPEISLTEKQFLNNTFNRVEIFNLSHKLVSNFSVESLRSLFHGRCYSVSSDKEYPSNGIMVIALLKKMDYLGR